MSGKLVQPINLIRATNLTTLNQVKILIYNYYYEIRHFNKLVLKKYT